MLFKLSVTNKSLMLSVIMLNVVAPFRFAAFHNETIFSIRQITYLRRSSELKLSLSARVPCTSRGLNDGRRGVIRRNVALPLDFQLSQLLFSKEETKLESFCPTLMESTHSNCSF